MRISILTSINDKKAENLTPGTIVSLEREPDNDKDPKAVKAMLGDVFIGYVANSAATPTGFPVRRSPASTPA